MSVIKQTLVIPLLHYFLIFIFLFYYVVFEWKNSDIKKNLMFVLFCIIILFTAIQSSDSINKHYLLDGLKSDTVVISNNDINISVNIEDLFQGKYSVFSESENMLDIIKNISRDSYIDLYFYKNDKKVLKLKLCESEIQNDYSYNITGKNLVLVYNGEIIRFNPIFYKQLNSKINEFKNKN